MFPFENLPFGHGLMNIPELKNNVHSAENILQFTNKVYLKSKSLYRSFARRHFYGTENEIWAGFGAVGNTEKKFLGRL